MEGIYQAPETLGSTVLLTNKTTISNKLLTLAHPKPRRAWICKHVKARVPSIGLIWYLPLSWLVHSYLEMNCIGEMNIIKSSHLASVVQVLLALSVAVLVIFTVAAVLRVSKSSNDPSFCDTYLKRLSVKYFLQATRHQIYLLQALAAFILINSYLLLHINQIAYDFPNDATDNETVAKEKNILEANSSDIQTLPLLPLSAEKLLTYLAFYGNFAIPLTIYAIQESEQLWKKEKLWGLLYSFILLLSPLKYLSSTLTFYIISVTTHKSPQNLLFEGVSKWLPSLYVTSVLSLFLFTLALKIYIELRLREPALSCGNIIVRREIRYYPLGVILTSVLILGCEIPYISHFIFFILNGNSDILIVYLLAFSIAFCFVAAAASLVVGFKKNQHATKSRIKKKRVDSGVCLVNSFVYQARSEAGKAEC